MKHFLLFQKRKKKQRSTFIYGKWKWMINLVNSLLTLLVQKVLQQELNPATRQHTISKWAITCPNHVEIAQSWLLGWVVE